MSKVRVETKARPNSYRNASVEHHIGVEARAGLTRPWRRFVAALLDVGVSVSAFLGFLVAFTTCALVLGLLNSGEMSLNIALGCFISLAISIPWTLYFLRLDQQRKAWRDERRAHQEAALIIDDVSVRVDGTRYERASVKRVRVEVQKAKAPATEDAYGTEHRYNLVADLENGEALSLLEALEQDSLETARAALTEAGLPFEGT